MSGEAGVAMNCRAIREMLNEALAAGEVGPLDRDAAGHLQACDSCRGHFEAQVKLYAAIDSGVHRLVENVAPPSLLPRVRERLAARDAQPNHPWVRLLVPSAVALLVAAGLLLLIPSHSHKVGETTTALVQPASTYSSVPDKKQLDRRESQIVSNQVTKLPARVSRRRERAAISNVLVIVDPREAAAFAPMINELARNPELALSAFHKGSLPASQGEAIEPVSIARLEIPALVPEVEAKE